MAIWIILVILYGIAVIFCWVRDSKIQKARQAELEERRRIQNAEWEAQLRAYPTLRLMLMLGRVRDELRQIHADDRLTLEELRKWQEHKPAVNWKEEGF